MALRNIVLCLAASSAILPSVVEGCVHHSRSSTRTSVGVRRRNITDASVVRTALINVRVFDGYQIHEPDAVFINDQGIIVPSMTEPDVVIDGLGGVLLPGFIDSHCHPETLSALEDLASYGVSTALGMACYDYSVCNGLRNQRGVAQQFSSGLAAYGAGGIGGGAASIANITSISQATDFVDYVFGNGSDYLKIVAADGGPNQATQNALVASAHAKGKATMTHATHVNFYEQAILSKSNGLQHSPGDGLLSADMISLMVKQKQYVTPTMEVARIILKLGETDPSILSFLGERSTTSYDLWRSNVMAMHQAGIPILAGTDAADVIPINGTTFGWTLHQELANLVDAGLTTAEALRSATLLPALLNNFPTRGRIAAGMRADLVLLAPGADPLQDIAATKNISRVWMGGLEYADVAAQPFPSF